MAFIYWMCCIAVNKNSCNSSMWGLSQQMEVTACLKSNCITNVIVCLCRTILRDSGFFRYLHTAVIVSGTMLVFGGNTHNDTSMSHGAKCFSSDFLAYSLGQ